MKLGIAVAMSHGAKLLLLDEPTSGLDPVVRDEVVEMFCDFTRDEDHSILISSSITQNYLGRTGKELTEMQQKYINNYTAPRKT